MKSDLKKRKQLEQMKSRNAKLYTRMDPSGVSIKLLQIRKAKYSSVNFSAKQKKKNTKKPLKSSLLGNLNKKDLERDHIFCNVHVSDYSALNQFYNYSAINVDYETLIRHSNII